MRKILSFKSPLVPASLASLLFASFNLISGWFAWTGRVYWPAVTHSVPICFSSLVAWIAATLVAFWLRPLNVERHGGKAVGMGCGAIILSIIMICLGQFFFWLGSMSHADSVRYQGRVFNLASFRDDHGWPTDYYFCECDSLGIFCNCREIYTDWRSPYRRPILIVNETKDQVDFYLGDTLVYEFGSEIRCHDDPVWKNSCRAK